MPRTKVKLSPTREEPPDWWAAEWVKRQNRARNAAVRILRKVNQPLSQGQIASIGGAYGGPEMRHALDTLVKTGVIRCFVRHEPYTTAFKVALGCESKMVDRIYYELTEQP